MCTIKQASQPSDARQHEHSIMGTGRIGSAGLPNSFIALLSSPAPAPAPCLAWCSLTASPAPPSSIPQTPAPLNDVPPPKSSIGSGRGSHGAGGCGDTAHASRTPPGTEQGCRASTAEVPNTAAAAAAFSPSSPPSAPNSENCSLLSCLLSRDLYRVVFASEGCEACLIVRSSPQVKNSTQCQTCIYYLFLRTFSNYELELAADKLEFTTLTDKRYANRSKSQLTT
jgi:hypothetical protein